MKKLLKLFVVSLLCLSVAQGFVLVNHTVSPLIIMSEDRRILSYGKRVMLDA